MGGSTTAQGQMNKINGVADIVFLIDITQSMAPFLDGLKKALASFIERLAHPGVQDAYPLTDWRAKMVGYRDVKADGKHWFEDNPFTSDEIILKDQLKAFQPIGGHDIPEDLLEALLKICDMGEDPNGQDPSKWRDINKVTRAVIVFTDAPFHPTTVGGGTYEDILNRLTAERIRLLIVAPDLDEYYELDQGNITYIPKEGEGLEEVVSDPVEMQKFFDILADQISKSASQPVGV